MLSFNFARWIRSIFRSRPKTYAKRPYVLFSVEQLEARETPADLTWTGLGAAPFLWSDTNNWLNGVKPSAASFDNLTFLDTVPLASRTMIVDIPGLNINSISINGDSFIFGGTQTITLGNPTTPTSGRITVGSGVGNDFKIDLVLAGQSRQFFQVDSGTDQSSGLIRRDRSGAHQARRWHLDVVQRQ
jgi:hypothetical protein